MGPHIRQVHNRIEVSQRQAEIVRVYRLAFQGPPYYKPEQEIEAFALQFMEHIERRGFRLFVAERDTELIGFIYGYDLWERRWLYQQLQPHIKDNAWLANSFQVVEFAVAPHAQGRGVGSRLYNHLLAVAAGYERYLLCTMASETAAMRLYRRFGWETLIDQHQFPGVPRLYRVMGKKK